MADVQLNRFVVLCQNLAQIILVNTVEDHDGGWSIWNQLVNSLGARINLLLLWLSFRGGVGCLFVSSTFGEFKLALDSSAAVIL